MHVEQLTARGFRNLEDVVLRPTQRVVVLQGANGEGKTNLLEALYLCATGRSFRHAPAGEMLMHGRGAAQVEAVVSRHGVRHDVHVALSPRGRSMRVDARALRHTAALLQLVNVVAFFPDDLRIGKGSPEERRRFLDRAVANSEPPFAAAATQYARVLRSRNALLRGQRSPHADVLAAFDAQLVTFGAAMHGCRLAALARLLPVARQHFAALMPNLAALDVALAGGVDAAASAVDLAADPDAAAAAYGARLAARLRADYPRDRARGATHAGPHRADLLSAVGGHALRAHGSQGQLRCLVLALKLAEVVVLAERLGTPPILLLDDVSSELDRERSRRLFGVVEAAGCQVWVSTTGAVRLPLGEAAQTVYVRAGALCEAP